MNDKANGSLGSLEFAVRDGQATMRVQGRGTFALARPLRQIGDKVANDGLRQLTVDLAACSSLDSTFIGGLTMIALAAQRGVPALVLANASERVAGQIAGLGIGQLFTFVEAQVEWPDQPASLPAAEPPPAPHEVAATALAAHQALAQADPANLDRFGAVIRLLEKEAKPSKP